MPYDRFVAILLWIEFGFRGVDVDSEVIKIFPLGYLICNAFIFDCVQFIMELVAWHYEKI